MQKDFRPKEMIPAESRFVTDNEQKLAVLYALNELGPVTDHQLLVYLTECDTMNWFAMQLGLLDLEDEGLTGQQAHPLGKLRYVTDAGRFCLQQFAGRIPVSKRETLKNNAAEWRLRFKNLRQSPAAFFTEPDGRIRLQLRMSEDNEIMMDLITLLPAGTGVTRIGEKWEKAAPSFYRELVLLLQPEQSGDHCETVFLENSDGSLMINLPAGTEENMAEIRRKWQENRNKLREKILKIL